MENQQNKQAKKEQNVNREASQQPQSCINQNNSNNNQSSENQNANQNSGQPNANVEDNSNTVSANNHQQDWQSFGSQQQQQPQGLLSADEAYLQLLQQFGAGNQQIQLESQGLEQEQSQSISNKKQKQQEKQNSFGCEHYQRNCLVEAPCCKIYYSCKLCHDDKYQGPKSKGCKVQRMQFDKVQHIQCLKCKKVQEPSLKCSNPQCQIVFGKYACLKCKLYENKPAKVNDIFHCDQCKMCRRGKVQDFFHCTLCGYCRPMIDKNNHKCSQNIAESQCPICLQVLKYSVKYYQKLTCGHLIHVKCYQEYAGLNCPVCGMATQKLSESVNKQIEQQVQQTRHNLPKQLIDKKVNIMCNQCLFKTIDAPFHFLGIKCQGCGSFNTKLI